MAVPEEYTIVEHQYGPGQTVSAVIKYYNDINMTPEEFDQVQIYYDNENNPGIKKPGDVVKIPILDQYKRD